MNIEINPKTEPKTNPTMNTQTRFKLTLAAAGFIALITLIALFLRMENIVLAGIAGIMTILSAYIWSQTTRPSNFEYGKNITQPIPPKSASGSGHHSKPVATLDK